MKSCAVLRGSSAGRLRSFHGRTQIFCGFGLKMAETRRRTLCATTMLKDRERHGKDNANYHCRNRAPFDIPSVHFMMIFSMASVRLSTG